jgi:mannose-6-phosphate isomerase-like protein (cupin superfamily)
MEHVNHNSAVKHVHSPHCTVYEYPMRNGELSLCIAEITRRYPDAGYAINHICSEMGYVLKGAGKLVTPTREVSLSIGDAVYIPPGEKYYWEGNLTLILPTTPAFHREQHEICLAPDTAQLPINS